MKSLLLTLSLVFFSSSALFAQSVSLNPDSRMWVDGTSTVHDWTLDVEKVNGTMFLKGDVVDSLRFIVPVSSMKSGKSGMDDKVFEALKHKSYPTISIFAKNVTFKEGYGSASAEVTIAGVKRTVPVTVVRTTQGNVASYTGKVDLKMTDFRVSPPTAMFGAIKAGDAITLRFDLKSNVR